MRISTEDKQERRESIMRALYQSDGLTEAELEELLGIQRRTINNHLRWLQKKGQVRKEGLVWYSNNRAVHIINKIITLLNELKQELEK